MEDVYSVGTQPLSDIIAGRVRDSRDLAVIAATVCDAIRTRVSYSFGCLATLDPATGLISWAMKTHPLEVGDEEFAAVEYGGPDVNLFSEIAQREEPVGVLSIDTYGDLDACRRHREFLSPRFGFTDELRVAFRSRGLTWGALALYRGVGEPRFSPADAATLVAVNTQVAQLIQFALFNPDRTTSTPGFGPAVVVVDSVDRVTNITPAAHQRIEELGGWDHGSLPSTLLVTSTTARTTPELAVNRAVGQDGAWLVVRATKFASPASVADAGSRDDVVITIDVASPADISALRLAARGLSQREQEVTELVLQGATTKTIATSLHLSPHTVQDHLKSIFAKLEVNSRREMVQQLVVA